MGNASKALIMAGGVLIAILLLTLFSYLFGQMASSTSSIYQILEKHEIDEFNQDFLSFEGRGKTALHRKNEKGEDEIYYNYLKSQDIATLLNLAQNAKKNSKFSAIIKITLDGTDISLDSSSKWLKENVNSTNKYICEKVNINSKTLLVDKVEILKEKN